MPQTLVTRRLRVSLLAAIAVVGLTVALVVASGPATADDPPQPTPHRDGRPAADFFSVLRGEGAAATSRDREIGERVVASLGLPNLRADSTRSVRSFKSGTTIRVIGGGSDYCLFRDEGQGLTCAKLNDRAGASSTPVLVLGAGFDAPVKSAQFAAMVGDGARDFALTVEGAGTVALTPRNSVVAAEVPGRPLRLTWRNADGSPGALTFHASE
ncbi:MAG TPA: hypothetical protein VGW75_13505 [Solirubrobacteraceae bacterium]|jgi:hypothetical protein|nr:hypothetical protein [Solirubrobacteraceae bacterium]